MSTMGHAALGHVAWAPLLGLPSWSCDQVSASDLKIRLRKCRSAPSSTELQWVDLEVGHQERYSNNGCLGDMPYWLDISMFNIARCCIHNDIEIDGILIRLWIDKIHPNHRPRGHSMECIKISSSEINDSEILRIHRTVSCWGPFDSGIFCPRNWSSLRMFVRKGCPFLDENIQHHKMSSSYIFSLIIKYNLIFCTTQKGQRWNMGENMNLPMTPYISIWQHNDNKMNYIWLTQIRYPIPHPHRQVSGCLLMYCSIQFSLLLYITIQRTKGQVIISLGYNNVSVTLCVFWRNLPLL